jgi:hypothetical protein
MDDILVFSKTLEEHKKHLQEVFAILQANSLYLKKSKCSFAQTKIEYLGHVISSAGVATAPDKIQAVKEWETPENAKQLRSFLGLAGYYRKFIQHYGLISKPLTDLLKKHSQFIWTPQHQHCFDTLKNALITAPVLSLPDFSKPFIIETDASDKGIGAVLMQQGNPVAYLSKALSNRSQALSTYEKECLAIILAVDRWKPYLQHLPFTIATDQRSLIHLGEQTLTDGVQHKAFVKLLGLQYQIMYKKGLDNKGADAMSRKTFHSEICAISAPKPRWLDIITEGYMQDTSTKQLLTELSISGSNDKGFSLHNGLIRYKGRIWLGNHTDAHQAILLALHDSGIGGHSGISATYSKIKALFAWPRMKQDITDYVNKCQVCQQAKSEHSKLPGLLHPLPVPTEVWQIVSLDFIEGLPKSNKFDTILVVIDKFTKYAHFIPLSHPYTAISIAHLYFSNIYKLHGLPQILISHRDRIFTSSFWKELFTLSQTTLNMSSSHHPQTDGQTERLNQCLES